MKIIGSNNTNQNKNVSRKARWLAVREQVKKVGFYYKNGTKVKFEDSVYYDIANCPDD